MLLRMGATSFTRIFGIAHGMTLGMGLVTLVGDVDLYGEKISICSSISLVARSTVDIARMCSKLMGEVNDLPRIL